MRPAVPAHALWAVIACAVAVSTMLLLATPATARSTLGPAYRVSAVSDGDTIKVVVGGKTERVRLVGIDTPELGRDGTSDQCFARAARSMMVKLVGGKRVHLRRDTTQANRDAYGRLLRYVYTAKGRRDVGKTLIAQGRARQYTYDHSYRHRSSYRSAERRAKKAGRGLWTSCGAAKPAPERSPTAPQPPTCVIKGNIADDGERIYHVPGQQFYDVTVVTPSRGERWFCSETDAVAAGWRRSQV